MKYEEAQEWLRGERSSWNSFANTSEDRATELAASEQADAALMQHAYWLVRAVHEGLTTGPPDAPRDFVQLTDDAHSPPTTRRKYEPEPIELPNKHVCETCRGRRSLDGVAICPQCDGRGSYYEGLITDLKDFIRHLREREEAILAESELTAYERGYHTGWDAALLNVLRYFE